MLRLAPRQCSVFFVAVVSMTGSAFGFLNGWAMDLATLKANLLSPSCNQSDDSIECYRQRLKKIRQKAPATVREEPAHKVNASRTGLEVADAKKIHEMIAATRSAQILGFLNVWVMDLAAFKANLLGPSCNQGDDSIECSRQRLKMIRQQRRTVREESAPKVNTVKVVDAQKIHEEIAAIRSAQILEAKLLSKLPTDSESISTNEPQSDPESDDADKSSDGQGDHIDEKAFINHNIFTLGVLPGADCDSRFPRVGPRGGLIIQPWRPSPSNAATTPTLYVI